MFSDRYWILKVGLSLGLFAWLCTRSAREFAVLEPELEKLAWPSETDLGKPVGFWARVVTAVHSDGFDISTRVGPIRVLAEAPLPSVGQHVSATGTALGRRLVQARRLQVNEGHRWKRALNYGLSAATVVVFLGLVRKRFRGRLHEGLFTSRY